MIGSVADERALEPNSSRQRDDEIRATILLLLALICAEYVLEGVLHGVALHSTTVSDGGICGADRLQQDV